METKLTQSKKGQALEKGITVAVIIIISVVVLLRLFADLVPEAQTAGDEFSDSNKCGEAGCFFNSTETPTCLINSSTEGQGVACNVAVQTVPLATLFGGQGIIILLLLASLFLGIIRIVMPKSRK